MFAVLGVLVAILAASATIPAKPANPNMAQVLVFQCRNAPAQILSFTIATIPVSL